LVVELTDVLQGGFESAIIAQPPFDYRFLLAAEADLLGATAGIGDGQYEDEMALAAGADGAAGAMADAALEQGAAVVEGRAAASLARASRVSFLCFIYLYETLKKGSVSRAFQTFS
jgi:hypothetical protein